MIYFIQEIGDRRAPVKIGWTARDGVRSRIESVQTGYPFGKLGVLGVMEGYRKEEGEEHAKWGHLRMSGEWFAPSRELLEHIDAVSMPMALFRTKTRAPLTGRERLEAACDEP